MQKVKSLLFFFLLTSIFFTNAHAKTFANQFTEFELPAGWDCALEGSEWVCQSDDKDRKKEAIIILAAKYRGEQDSLDQYQAYLKQPKTFTLPGGKTQISEAKSLSVRTINNQRWVDALHLASEVPGFYTRYLATVKDNLGVAITFSVSKDHYDAYQDIFEKVIATLKVFDQKSADAGKWTKKKEEGDLVNESTVIGDTTPQVDITKQKKGGDDNQDSQTTMLLLLVAAAAVIFFIIKKRKKK